MKSGGHVCLLRVKVGDEETENFLPDKFEGAEFSGAQSWESSGRRCKKLVSELSREFEDGIGRLRRLILGCKFL